MRWMLIVAAGLILAPAAASAGDSAGDPAAGEKVFRKCRACHSVGDGARNKVGPVLNGIIGRRAGTVDGYKYSAANKNSGVVWTVENLDAYLTKPRDFMKGTRMAFAGLADPGDRADLIAYLAQFK